MGGFGSGPFGTESFGEWKWSRAILFDLVPQLYRTSDQDVGKLLESYLESLRDPLDNLRRKIGHFEDLRDPFKVRTRFNERETLRLGYRIIFRGDLEQRGVDGTISIVQEFRSPTARFQPEDRGKELTISGSTVIGNNRSVLVSGVVNATTILTEPPLTTDAGLLRWELRTTAKAPQDRVICKVQFGDVSDIAPGWILTSKGATFEVLSRRQFTKPTVERRLLTDREGIDGLVDAQGRFQSATLALTQADVGKYLTVFDSLVADNIGRFEILSVDTIAPNDLRATFSRLLVRGVDSNGGVIYTLKLGAKNVFIQHRRQGLATSFQIISTFKDGVTTIIVQLATNNFGVVTTVANTILAGILGDPLANAVVTATVTGTGAGVSAPIPLSKVEGETMTPDGGPLTWALLPYPELELSGQSFPNGVIDRGGDDLTVILSAPSNSTIKSGLGVFVLGDVGRTITIRGSLLGNDGVFVINGVTAADTATVRATLTVEATSLTWELREPTSFGDGTQVEVAAPSLIPYLAKDFGIEIDDRESELRQRSWVRNVSRWIDMKGLAKSYEIIGAISGFNVTVKALFRVTADLFGAMPNADKYEVGEAGVGRFGADGTLFRGAAVRFTSPTAKFLGTDIGRQIRIRNAGVAGNNKLFTISLVIDSKTVEFRFADSATFPEPRNGTLEWSIVRLYTDLPPLLPLFDEVNADLMERLIDGLPPQMSNHWGIDKFCWEADFNSKIGVGGFGGTVNVVAIAALAPTIWSVVATGDVDVIVWVGHWKFIDSVGNTFFVETLPTFFLGFWFFTVISNISPVPGAATLEYVCSIQLICEYCAASKVLATIETGSIAEEGGVAIEKVLQRVLDRLKEEVTPAHVELIAIFRQNIIAGLNIRVTVTV